MPTIHRSLIVPYTPAQMYVLVNDVAAYPLFLPWCSASKILSQTEDEIRANLELTVSGIQKSFSTCNRLQVNKMIEIRLLDGPFRHLEGFWRFDTLSSGCQISFDLSFEFSNKLIAMAFGGVFQRVTETLADAFVKRAHELYGAIGQV